MIKTNCYLIVLFALVASCNSKPRLIPQLKFGEPEQEWRRKVERLASEGILERRKKDVLSLGDHADTAYLFKWNLADTSYVMQVDFNSKTEAVGPLLNYSMQLTEDTMSSTSTTQIRTLPQGFQFFKSSDIRGIENRIKKIFGPPDSMASDNRELWYRKDQYDVVITLPESMVTLQKDTVYNPLWVQVYSKNYKKDYDAFNMSKVDALRPEDIFRVDFTYRQVMHRGDRGVEYPALQVSAIEESTPTSLNTRLIKSAKGTLVIKDAYKDVLLEIPNSEYVLSTPLCCGKGNVFPQGGQGWFIALNSRPETTRLREALRNVAELSIQFRPEVVLFEDGGVLR